MMEKKKRLQAITKSEKQNQHLFIAGVIAALSYQKRHLTIATVSGALAFSLGRLERNAADLADAHTQAMAGEGIARDYPDRQPLREAAIATAAGALVRTFFVNQLQEIPDALAEAISANKYRLNNIASTEFFAAYNERYAEKVASENPGARLVWVADLDKRTCNQCSSLHGTSVLVSVGFKVLPPVHPNCRCIIDLKE